jgi:hypothetical protein
VRQREKAVASGMHIQKYQSSFKLAAVRQTPGKVISQTPRTLPLTNPFSLHKSPGNVISQTPRTLPLTNPFSQILIPRLFYYAQMMMIHPKGVTQSGHILEYLSDHHPDQIGEIVYLFQSPITSA